MSRVEVIVDTSILWSGHSVNERAVRALCALQDAGHVRLHIPEVVMLELVRHATELEKRVQREEQKLSACLRSIGQAWKRDDLGATNWAEAMRRMFEDVAVIDPLPGVTHTELLARDLGNRRPFQASGKGYRDALVWETLLEVVEESPAVLLTANKNDFGTGKPHPDLMADLSRNTHVVVISDVSELQGWLANPPSGNPATYSEWDVEAPISLGAIRAAIDGWPEVTASGVRFGRRITEDADIEEIAVSSVRSVIELESMDGFGGFEAELEVEAEVGAEVERAKLGLLDADVHILEAESGQEYVAVRATRPLRVRATFTYRLDTMDLDEARVDEAWYSGP